MTAVIDGSVIVEQRPVVELRGVTAGYGAVPVLKDLSFVVQPGKVVALLGANGAGKTTTLRAVAGQIGLSGGQVLFDGHPARRMMSRRVREGMAYIPENRAVFRSLSCRDNLRLGGGLSEALQIFPQLAERLNVAGGMLSGGEQQMVGLARALSRKPRLIIADELSLGLAPMIVDQLLASLREAADGGAAVLLVEQHVRKAIAIADEGHVLARGVIKMSGDCTYLAGRIDEIERAYLSVAPDSDSAEPIDGR